MTQLTLFLLAVCFIPFGRAVGDERQEPKKTAILFQNARVFDGKSDRLLDGMNLLVVGNKIAL